MSRWMAIGAVGSVLCSALLGCGEPSRAERERAPKNVLLIVVDTLGAAHLGCYGGEKSASPNIDRLAAEGLRFERAYATAPWTQPSIASIFTSEMPSQHGVQELSSRLPKKASTLAEAFQRAGVATHGIVSNRLLAPDYGFGQGFRSFDPTPITRSEGISSEKVTDAALRWLEKHGAERFFLFAHYSDPHHLYNDHAESQLADGYSGRVRAGMPIWELRDLVPALEPRDREHLVALYREEIAHSDAEIGRLLERLEELGLSEQTLIVLTADHGEELLEHGWIGHTRTLYDELLRVPLIFHLPGVVEPGVSNTPVSLVDLAPTLLDFASIERPEAWGGLSRAAELRGRARAAPDRPIFAEVAYLPPAELDDEQIEVFKTALLDGRWKLIHDELSGSYELYDLLEDPSEEENRWGEEGAPGDGLRERLLEWERSRNRSSAERVQPSSDEIEELRKLGYVR